MDVNIATYRRRIGGFNTSKQISYIPVKTRKRAYNSNTGTIFYNLRKLITCMSLLLSILSRIESDLQLEEENNQQDTTTFGCLSKATDPVNFFILGGQVCFFPALHLSF